MFIAVEKTRLWTVAMIGRMPDLGLDVRTSTGLGARPYRPTKKPYICPHSFSSLTQKKLVNQEASIYVLLWRDPTCPPASSLKSKEMR